MMNDDAKYANLLPSSQVLKARKALEKSQKAKSKSLTSHITFSLSFTNFPKVLRYLEIKGAQGISLTFGGTGPSA